MRYISVCCLLAIGMIAIVISVSMVLVSIVSIGSIVLSLPLLVSLS